MQIKFSLFEIITIFLLCISIAALVYLWKTARKRMWYFGILPERLFRQNIVLREQHLPYRNTQYEGDYCVVLPLKSISTNRLPLQMYEGESELVVLHPLLQESQEDDSIITADLETWFGKAATAEKLKQSRTELENYAVLKLVHQKVGKGTHNDRVKYLSVEILSSAFEIAGDRIQRQLLRQYPMSFTWSITAKSSGKQKLAFVFRAEDETEKEIVKVGMLSHEVRVASIARLNHRQVRILIGIIGMITTILAIVETLQRIGII
jgi:hypothetical protein